MKIFLPLLLLLTLLLPFASFAQKNNLEIKSIGLPLITNYGPADFDSEVNNYDVIIGDDQRIYFGNEQGILVYDGRDWQRVSMPNKGAVYALAKTESGTIYVGGVAESGYLEADTNGVLQYYSLNPIIYGDSVPGSVRMVRRNGDQIISLSSYDIAFINPKTNEVVSSLDKRWPGDTCYAIPAEEYYCACGDELFVLKEQGWTFVRKTPIAKHVVNSLVGPLQIDDKRILITANGFYDFDSDEEIAIAPGVKDFLKNNYVYRVNLLPNDYIAISSWSGLLIVDKLGNPVQFITAAKGLTDDYVFGAAMDDSGVLWVATYNGISKISISSEFSFIDSKLGAFDGIIHDAALFNDHVYISSARGIYQGSWSMLDRTFQGEKFTKINDLIGHYFIVSDAEFFITSEQSPNLVLEQNQFAPINGTEGTIYWTGFKYRASEDVLFASFDGLMVHARKVNNRWQTIRQLDPSFNSIELLIQGEGNEIWASGKADGIYKINYDVDKAEILTEKKYTASDGLASNQNNYVFDINSQPHFGTEKGIYRYDKITDRLVPDPNLMTVVGEVPVKIIRQHGHDIYYLSDQLYQLNTADAVYTKKGFPNLDYKKYFPANISIVDDENVLISSANGVVHLNPTLAPDTENFCATISGLSLIDTDTVLYGGFGPIPNLVFPSEQNSFRIEFTNNYYEGVSNFKWKLEGLDEDWSSWSDESSKDYTNLSHGKYLFSVVSQNIYGQESLPANMEFEILAPWFLTTWAYLFYLVLGSGFVYGVVILYTTRLKAENKKLENKVELRTQELSKRTDELMKQNELKKRFFVNISHELRTPLTLTMGTLERALGQAFGHINTELEKNLKISFNNAERLLKMVNSILDISRLEGGNTKLQATMTDPVAVVEKVLAFFHSKFLNKGIQLEKDLVACSQIYLDQDKFETILINLISNAFKFTPKDGVIKISMEELDEEIKIIVKDSGQGIPEKDLPFVFDRFYQSPSIKSGEGLGVGLALTKELIDLHHGQAEVTNEYGAKFVLTFKKGAAHLNDEEIVDADQVQDARLVNKYHINEQEELAPRITDATGDKPHVLIVEDNADMQQYISDLLSVQYAISRASNGNQALKILNDVVPDMIISDYLMPEMNGFEFATEVKKSKHLSFVPFIFLTARTDEEGKLQALNLGIDDYIFKPFNAKELLIRIGNLLHAKKSRLDFIEEEAVDESEIEWKDFQSLLKDKIEQYIDDHLDENITADHLTEETGLSERSLYRKVKSNTGLSLLGYVKEYRLRKARTMLETRQFETVSEVSYAIGYKYLSHFTKNYKARFGRQPSDYLQM